MCEWRGNSLIITFGNSFKFQVEFVSNLYRYFVLLKEHFIVPYDSNPSRKKKSHLAKHLKIFNNNVQRFCMRAREYDFWEFGVFIFN